MVYPCRNIVLPQIHDEHTVFLLHGNEFRDASMYGRSVTNSGATVSTAVTKFGNGSLSFNGAAKVLADAYEFGGGDFTIDWWEYVTGAGGTRFSGAYTQGSDWGSFIVGHAGLYFFAGTYYNSWDIATQIQMFSVTANQWVHWAFIRNGNTFKSYRNGTLFATHSASGSILTKAGVPMSVGDYRAGDPNPYTGYIEEFRISDIARWTANFTPPTEPYRG